MRYYGAIGYGETKESSTDPGVYENSVTEVAVQGFVIRQAYNNQRNEYISSNENVILNNRFDILYTKDILDHLDSLLYIMYNNKAWQIKSLEVIEKRLMIEVGGPYNDTRGT